MLTWLKKNTIFQMKFYDYHIQANESEGWAHSRSWFFSSPSANSFAVAFFLVSRAFVRALVPLKMRHEEIKHGMAIVPG